VYLTDPVSKGGKIEAITSLHEGRGFPFLSGGGNPIVHCSSLKKRGGDTVSNLSRIRRKCLEGVVQSRMNLERGELIKSKQNLQGDFCSTI